MADEGYLLAGRESELERLRVQSYVWEAAGRDVLAELGDGAGLRVLEVGCGVLGWLRVLSEWVGPTGQVVGTDVAAAMLAAAAEFVAYERLENVRLVQDDLFASRLEPASFDLVHARFLLAPLGRAGEQLAAFRRLVVPGGVLVLEEPDSGSWHFNPPADAAERLIELITDAFRQAGGDFDAGRSLPGLLADLGLEPATRAAIAALPAQHPYLRAPLQFSAPLEPRIAEAIGQPALDELRARAETELGDARRWGTTFTLVQSWARIR